MMIGAIQQQIDEVAITGKSVVAFEREWRRLEGYVRHAAKLLAREHDDREELIQEAMFALSQEDPSRIDFLNRRQVSAVKRILFNRMLQVRREWRYVTACSKAASDTSS